MNPTIRQSTAREVTVEGRGLDPHCVLCGGYLLPCAATATGHHPRIVNTSIDDRRDRPSCVDCTRPAQDRDWDHCFFHTSEDERQIMWAGV